MMERMRIRICEKSRLLAGPDSQKLAMVPALPLLAFFTLSSCSAFVPSGNPLNGLMKLKNAKSIVNHGKIERFVPLAIFGYNTVYSRAWKICTVSNSSSANFCTLDGDRNLRTDPGSRFSISPVSLLECDDQFFVRVSVGYQAG